MTMKPVLMLLLALALTFTFTATDSEASLRIEQIQIDADRSTTTRQPITNKVIELQGPEQQVSFFYEMKSDSTERDQEFVLRFQNSELLMAPSSLTVQVDGKPITSQPLNGEKESKELVIPLQKEALTQGVHEITVQFYGVIKEGICVEQGTSANWLAIQVDSYLQLSGQQPSDRYLADYPAAFIGKGKYPVAIIIPQKASVETLDSALKVGAFLSESTDEKFPIQIKREDDVESLSSNVIIMGAIDEFSSSAMKSLLKQASLTAVENSMILSYETITDGEGQVDALLAISETPAALGERVSVLTEPKLYEQMTGRQFRVRTMPVRHSKETGNTVKLSQFGIEDITLNGSNRESQQFFHYTPFAMDKNRQAVLELHLKRSARDTSETTATEEVFRGPIELTVLVNDVPHSINLDDMSDPQEGVYSVQLPIDKSAMKENRMISLQLQASGLMAKNPCVTTDHNRWIYIEKDSFITFPKEKTDSENSPSIAQFPSPFVDEADEALVVLPKTTVADDELLYLYRKLYVNSHPMNWKLADGEELKEEELKSQHALFMGGPSVQPLLKAKQKELAVSYATGKPDLAALGFMEGSSKSVSFIQRSLWGNSNRAMMVIDSLTAESQIDRPLVDFLQLTDDVATVAVLSNNRKVYTNASQIEAANSTAGNNTAKASARPSVGWLVGFGILLAVAIVSVFVVLRRRRRGVE
ncbi:hypothetical protein CSV69_07555 [Sporosarcina sp. P26b]|nr:hypothetical protein CSV69_07555 [Sporosarcina sp. P26b]